MGIMHNDHPEKQWIQASQRGDIEALALLVEHFRRPLFAFILNMQQGRGDAEEIFQEVWLRAIRHLPRYREKNFAGWLFRIARNLFIDQVRRNQRTVSPQSASGEPVIEMFPDHQPDPAATAGATDLGARIREALGALSADQREVFLMRTEAAMSFKEIAAAQNVSLNTALSRMNYALQKLRPLLLEDYAALGKE